MLKAPRHRFQGLLNRPPGCGRLAQNPKKILNKGNELKDLLKTQGLAFSGSQNEPLFSAKTPLQNMQNGGN
jgi:hypothetical protein